MKKFIRNLLIGSVSFLPIQKGIAEQTGEKSSEITADPTVETVSRQERDESLERILQADADEKRYYTGIDQVEEALRYIEDDMADGNDRSEDSSHS